jgi:hypothetical protein
VLISAVTVWGVNRQFELCKRFRIGYDFSPGYLPIFNHRQNQQLEMPPGCDYEPGLPVDID